MLSRPISKTPQVLAMKFQSQLHPPIVNKIFPKVLRGNWGKATQSLDEKEVGVRRINSK